jgi:hypothetical protein
LFKALYNHKLLLIPWGGVGKPLEPTGISSGTSDLHTNIKVIPISGTEFHHI